MRAQAYDKLMTILVFCALLCVLISVINYIFKIRQDTTG